ncbi:MAG: GNAT family N-acetyltransferase [Elusimicrobia bacterium]|nr:GNAT family N-acetyltransferase [Elusimicrobiota bacterium]
MSERIDVVSADTLDYEKFVRLQKIAFDQVLRQHQASFDHLNPDYYRWKYNNPEGPSRIAQVWNEDELVSANAMSPFDLASALGNQRIWISSESATLPKARGRGLLLKCLNALREDLGPNFIFCGFPNPNSKPRFSRFGWQEKALLRLWVAPRSLLLGQEKNEIILMRHFDGLMDECISQIVPASGPLLKRNAGYLNWRYTTHPIWRYEIFFYMKDHVVRGFCVLRQAAVKGYRLALIMELWGRDADAVSVLLSHGRFWAAQKGLFWTVLFDSNISTLEALRAGYFCVPPAFVPREFFLMGQALGQKEEKMWAMPWRLQSGDWDAF